MERLNWQQACKLLGCSKGHFYRLVNSGELPAERYGKTKGVTVRRADCERYLREWRQRVAKDF
ncbi:MAG: helix-turn-helix domain-containing protein [Desulfobulbaceae bacterium]|jgi:excisionase family DNA binding protein|nr:helix-turn-helix domain-containing protein [Desulfobulbaceae bacterium]